MRTLRTAVVTGPTGAIGNALCKKLMSEGIIVYAIVRPGSPRCKMLPQGVQVIGCDLSELSTLPERLNRAADAFYHLAWEKTTGEGRNDVDAQLLNVRYAVEAVRAAHRIGCRVFIGVGSQAEYGRVEGMLRPDTPVFPENGYGIAKLCAGQMTRLECCKLGIEHVWIRVLSVYGPYDGASSMITSTIRKLLVGERPALTAGLQQWDYLYSADAAEALYLCARQGRNGAIYPLGSGDSIPLRLYIEKVRDAIDPALPLGFGEVSYGPQQVMHLQADISALRTDTGFAPRTPFNQGIRNTIDWVRSL